MSYEEQANQELATKLELEALFLAPLTAIYNKIAKDMKAYYLASRMSPEASIYFNDFNTFFNNLYTDTSTKFSEMLQDELIKDNQDIEFQLKQSTQLPLGLFIGNSALLNTKQVLTTNQKDINEARMKALLTANKDKLDTEQTSDLMQNNFLNTAQGRYSTILITGVQTASEGSKDIVAQQYNKLINVKKAQKIWVNMMDDRVREAHVIAGFQRRDINKPYDVGGEQLMYPGDASLGASLSNIINCRCVSVYDLG